MIYLKKYILYLEKFREFLKAPRIKCELETFDNNKNLDLSCIHPLSSGAISREGLSRAGAVRDDDLVRVRRHPLRAVRRRPRAPQLGRKPQGGHLPLPR